MFIASNLIRATAELIGLILTIFTWVLIIRALVSWVSPDPYNPIVQFLHRVTEPVLEPIRRILPMGSMRIDLSPLIAIFLIIFLKSFLVTSLIQLAHRMN